MKKAILGLLSAGAAASALAQGTVIFENSSSAGNITRIDNGVSSYVGAGTYTVALLWAPGGSLGTAQANFQQIALYGLATGGATSTGFFTDSATVTTPSTQTPGTVGVFEVEGWTGNYTSYAAAVAGGASVRVGLSAEFLNGTGNPNPPGLPPVQTTGWDGNLIMVSPAPEPGTLALGGLGAAALLYFRRKK